MKAWAVKVQGMRKLLGGGILLGLLCTLIVSMSCVHGLWVAIGIIAGAIGITALIYFAVWLLGGEGSV